MPQWFLKNFQNKSQQSVLLTGVTGLLGTQLLKVFLNNTDFRIFLLVRASNQELADLKIQNLLKERGIGINNLKRINVLCGDQTQPNLGLNQNQYKQLASSVNQIFHSAALAEFRRPIEEVRFVNVNGTKNILRFASNCRNFQQLHYISTAFISGNSQGAFLESDLSVGQKFNNTYEQSKYEAELVIRSSAFLRKTIIYRPSIIVGEYDSGFTNNFRMFYQPFRSISLGIFNKIPINFSTKLNLIPCDFAAQVIFALSSAVKSHDVYHIVSPGTVSIMHLMKFAANFFKYNEPEYIAHDVFSEDSLSAIQRKIIEPYIPYFTFRATFGCQNTYTKLQEFEIDYPAIDDNYLLRLFQYCKEQGYIK